MCNASAAVHPSNWAKKRLKSKREAGRGVTAAIEEFQK
jgi:hypothetical protein